MPAPAGNRKQIHVPYGKVWVGGTGCSLFRGVVPGAPETPRSMARDTCHPRLWLLATPKSPMYSDPITTPNQDNTLVIKL